MSSSTNNEAISETEFKNEINEKMWEAFMAKKSVGKEACIACIKYLSDEDKKELLTSLEEQVREQKFLMEKQLKKED
jgi:hypothetical protein